MDKIPQEWLEKAKNKSWFYSNYMKKFSKELDEASKNIINK